MDATPKKMIEKVWDFLKGLILPLIPEVWFFQHMSQEMKTAQTEGKPAAEIAKSLRDFFDESRALHTFAALKEKLVADGMPGDEAQRKVAAVAEFFANRQLSTAKQGVVFRYSLLCMQDAKERLRIMELFYNGDTDQRKALIQSVARQPDWWEWLKRKLFQDTQTWNETVADHTLVPTDMALRLDEFQNSLGWAERLQLSISIGSMEPRNARRDAIEEISRVGQTNEERLNICHTRGYVMRSIPREIADFVRTRRREFETVLGRYERVTGDWADRGTDIMNNPPAWNWFARGINRIRR